jgi:hypothetical protein
VEETLVPLREITERLGMDRSYVLKSSTRGRR